MRFSLDVAKGGSQTRWAQTGGSVDARVALRLPSCATERETADGLKLWALACRIDRH